MAAKVLFLSAFVLVAALGGIEAHRSNCSPHQFRCFDGKCIQRTFFCDRLTDCGDGSDEKYCDIDALSAGCPTEDKKWFPCGNLRRCIPSEWRCDRRKDCPDHSDEKGCHITTANPFYLPAVSLLPEIGEESSSGDNGIDAPYITSDHGIEASGDFFAVTAEPFYLPTTLDEGTTLHLGAGDGETAINSFPGVRVAVTNLTQRLLETRKDTRSINKWGPHLLRTTVALFLTNSSYFAPGNMIGNEIAYELSLHLMSGLALKKKVSIQELSLFINALTVSCINPRDFFGVDLVAQLRTRVNNSNYTNPFIFLTLCNAGDSMTQTDVLKVNSTFYARHRPLWTGIQAFATMAMACISTRSNFIASESILSNMVAELKKQQPKNGTNGNLKTTSLVLQALISTDSYQDDFALGGALKFILKELNSNFTSLKDIYYVLPVLNSKSLVDISLDHCTVPVITELEMLKKLREQNEERIQTRVSVFWGEEKDFVRTWQLKVPSNYSFYQVLERIALLEPTYKVYYSVSEDKKPHVIGLSRFFDDAADGLYWFIYVKNMKNATKPRLVEKSPVDIPLKEDEELILWYRSGEWADPH